MTHTPANILCYGEDRPLPGDPITRLDPTDLSVGRLYVTYAGGDLRYLRAGGVELLRRIYVAVRDRNWGTIPAELSEVHVRQDGPPDGFHITYTARHRGRDADGEIDFEWSADVRGETGDGGLERVTFTMDGVARTGFMTNRIGLCVLHPIRHCAGRPCAVEHTDGSIEHGAFPELVTPHQPFKDIRAITHEPVPGVRVEVRFDGDVFEMEDQRNWTDGSFKTYSRPLERPFPYRVETGERVRQTVTVTVTCDVPERPADPAWTLAVQDRPVGRVPGIGVRLYPGRSLNEVELARVKALNLSHLRVELRPRHFEQLGNAIVKAVRIGAPLEVSVRLSSAADEASIRASSAALGWSAEAIDFLCKHDEEAQLRAIAEQVRKRVASPPPFPLFCRWLILHEQENVTSPRWVELARRILGEVTPGVPIGGGTRFDFVELNRNRPPLGSVDFLSFAVSPQVHATDDLSIMENLEGQAEVVRTARAFAPGVPLSVGPVTLKRGENPAATGPEAEPPVGALPPNVDPRQAGLVGAAWTLGSLKYLAEAGADFVTYYETVGWQGVMEAAAGSPLPDKFRSHPGGVFPLYHVLADVGEFAGGEVLACEWPDPLEVAALALRKGSRMRILLANLTCDTVGLRLPDMPPPGWAIVGLKELSTWNVSEAVTSPEAFRALPIRTPAASRRRSPTPSPAKAETYESMLFRFGILRIDLERVSDEQQ